MAHTQSPVTLPACALHQLFVRSCDLAHHGLYCSHVHVCTHHSSPQHLPFRCLPSLSFCAHMDELQGMRLPLGTTEWNHSYYTASSLSALHSLQQLQAGATSPSPVQMSASTRQSHDAAPSSSVSCPQVTLSATHPQVPMGPPALPQVTFCQLRSLRLPRSSPLLPFWSVASLPTLPHRPATSPYPTSGCRYADYPTHRCLSGCFYPTLVQGVLGSTFYARCSLPHVCSIRPLFTS